LRAVQAARRSVPFDPAVPIQSNDRSTGESDIDEIVLRAERNQMIRDGLRELPVKERQLLEMMSQDPTPSYKEIANRLNIPIGSIGPLRARYLAKLRETRAMRAYFAPQQFSGRI
jgi:RNA polymerase sigma factor (sigma-70 family)